MIFNFIYDLVWVLLAPFILIRMLWRSFRLPSYRKRLQERFAFLPPSVLQGIKSAKPTIYLHTVSVGEFIAALPLIKKMQTVFPHYQLFITTTTPTGSEQVRKHLGDTVLHCYLPYDHSVLMRRFIRHVNPVVALIFETELWYNLCRVCDQNKIPVLLLNARLSEKSARGYQRFHFYTRRVLSHFKKIAASAQQDAERFIALGYPSSQIEVVGNIKFDSDLDKIHAWQQQGHILRQQLGRRLVWIAASTHAGEEILLLEAHQQLRETYPDLLLILVPRHPDRFKQVEHLILQTFSEVQLRTTQQPVPPTTAVFLGNTMGEMMIYYAASDLAFVGGSLVPVGGHNVLEPAALGVAAIIGVHDFNFHTINQQLLEVNGLIRLTDHTDLSATINRLLSHPNQRQEQAQRAKSVILANQGAAQKMLQMIQRVVLSQTEQE